MTRRTFARLLAPALLIALLGAPAQASAGWRDSLAPVGTGATIAVDLLLVRPLGLVAIVVGAGALVPVAVVTAPNGRHGLEEATELFVEAPFRYVFDRPLGDL